MRHGLLRGFIDQITVVLERGKTRDLKKDIVREALNSNDEGHDA
jgi:hypothetical protein